MFQKNATFIFLAALLSYGSSAFAIRFTSSEFYWSAEVGKPYSVDLKTLVADFDRSKPAVWSSDYLPKWAKLDAANGVLAGTPDATGSDMFSILAVQDGRGDAARVYLQLEDAATTTQNLPVWFMKAITMEGCVGRPVATDDLQMRVQLTNPGMRLPIPEIVITTVNRPAWLTEIRKADGGYYLTGVATAAGDYPFTARACANTTCSDVAVTAKISATCAD